MCRVSPRTGSLVGKTAGIPGLDLSKYYNAATKKIKHEPAAVSVQPVDHEHAYSADQHQQGGHSHRLPVIQRPGHGKKARNGDRHRRELWSCQERGCPKLPERDRERKKRSRQDRPPEDRQGDFAPDAVR